MNGERILVVEDDFLANLALCELLQEAGYRTESSYCAAAALGILRQRPPWALVTDLDLGPGRTGFDIARSARSADPSMRVVYVSGQVGGRFPRDAVEGSQFVSKPYRGEEILAALRGETPPKRPLFLPPRSVAPPSDAEPQAAGPLKIGDPIKIGDLSLLAPPQVGGPPDEAIGEASPAPSPHGALDLRAEGVQ